MEKMGNIQGSSSGKRKLEQDKDDISLKDILLTSSSPSKKISVLGGEGVKVTSLNTVTVTATVEEGKGVVFQNFEGFTVDSVLSNSADSKRIVVEGSIGGEKAIVILDKKPFTEETLPGLFTEKSQLTHSFQNDIYGSYDCFLEPKLSAVKTTIVYPATQKHIDKYRIESFFLVEETPEVYKNVTLPFLETNSFNIQWVYNILEHKKETERIVFEDADPEKGFVLLPDLKWDGETLNNLYLVAIVHKRGLKSLRDLTEEHLPLLENVFNAGKKAIEAKYGLSGSQLRIYLHYQPSYYHLHVHFNALSFNAPGITTEKSHILQSVIDNIKLVPDFYQRASLPFLVKKGDALHGKLAENGYQF